MTFDTAMGRNDPNVLAIHTMIYQHVDRVLSEQNTELERQANALVARGYDLADLEIVYVDDLPPQILPKVVLRLLEGS